MKVLGFNHAPLAHHTGTEHAVAVSEATEHTHAGAGLLGGHGIELVIFTFGTVIFLIFAVRMFYLEYQRTGQWRWRDK